MSPSDAPLLCSRKFVIVPDGKNGLVEKSEGTCAFEYVTDRIAPTEAKDLTTVSTNGIICFVLRDGTPPSGEVCGACYAAQRR